MISCYACNELLTEEEMLHWMPFEICAKCKQASEEYLEQIVSAKAALAAYWSSNPADQTKIRQVM